MFHSSRDRRVRAAVALIAIVGLAGSRLAADTRKVTVESLIYDLNNPDPLRREAAARQLGVARYRPATPKLVALARDPATPVRREVELALEAMDDPQALPGFIAFATDLDDDLRSRAVAALVNMHLPRTSGVGAALSKLTDLITSTSGQGVDVVVEPDVPVDPSVVDTLRARTVDSERGIRRTAVRGLGILRAKAAVPDLLQTLREDRDDSLRFEAARALHKIGDPSIADPFVSLLLASSENVRTELIATLGSLRFRGAVPELTRIVEQTARTDATRIQALSALADIADRSSLALFDQLKADPNALMRVYANEGIARTADASAKDGVSGARLVEKDARVRIAQAYALYRFGQNEYLEELTRGLKHAATRDLAREYLLETRSAAASQ
jgi:HEAT repeat protein